MLIFKCRGKLISRLFQLLQDALIVSDRIFLEEYILLYLLMTNRRITECLLLPQAIKNSKFKIIPTEKQWEHLAIIETNNGEVWTSDYRIHTIIPKSSLFNPKCKRYFIKAIENKRNTQRLSNTCGIVRARVGVVTAEACAFTFPRAIPHLHAPVVLLRNAPNATVDEVVAVVANDPPTWCEVGNHARCAAKAAAMAVGSPPPYKRKPSKLRNGNNPGPEPRRIPVIERSCDATPEVRKIT